MEIDPPARTDGTASYSIGRRSYYHMRIANCDFFVLDTRGQREMHDTADPYKRGLSMLGKEQFDWLVNGTQQSDADFIFVVSSVNFMVPHVGGGAVRAENKDDAWTVFFDGPEGQKVGEFYSTCLCPESTFGPNPFTAFNVEIQTFDLREGMLFGIAGGGDSGETGKPHAVLGGTGRYSGARGSYAASPVRCESEKRGQIELRLTLQI